jgi:uncharacterized RDD family membrane protein YckC
MPTEARSNKIRCHARVITPENIAFEYALAGPFQRLPAFLSDVLLRSIVFWVLAFVVILGMSLVNLNAVLGPFLGFLGLVIYFLFSWFYGIYFETYFNGRTPGKMLFKLRAIGVDGRPINGVQAAIRNLLRLADMNVMLSLQIFGNSFPPAFMIPTMSVGLLAMLATSRMQRIGDLAAGTMVVNERRRSRPFHDPPDDNRAFGLAELIPPSYEVGSSLAQAIGLYMENRARLGSRRREEIAGRIGGQLIDEFQLLPDTSNDLLLCALFVRIYLTEEQRTKGLSRLHSAKHPRLGNPAPSIVPLAHQVGGMEKTTNVN